MCSKVTFYNQYRDVKDYVHEKEWVEVAILIGSLVLLGGIIIPCGLGSNSQFLRLLNQAIMEHKAALIGVISGGTVAVCGVVYSTVLFLNGGRSPLHVAVENKKPLEQWPLEPRYLNRPDYKGNTPLHYAVEDRKTYEKLAYVHGINVNAKNHAGQTPLELAIQGNKKEIVHDLVGRPDSVFDKQTIVSALQQESEEAALDVFKSEKIINLRRQALFGAIEKGKKELVSAILAKYENSKHQDLFEALLLTAFYHKSNSLCYGAIFDALLKRGVSINSISTQVRTRRCALHEAIFTDNLILVRKLLEHPEIDLSIADQNGETPLVLAIQWGLKEIVTEILRSNKVPKEELEKALIAINKFKNRQDWEEIRCALFKRQ